MAKAILGIKRGMTQIFDDQGNLVPVTVIESQPSVVVQKKTVEKDGYLALQLGFGEVKERRLTRPLRGHYAKARVTPRRWLREVRVDSVEGVNVGDEITVSIFEAGEHVAVTGVSKGKGFQGVVKRFHFGGGPKSHGSMIHRKPQSAGATDAARVFKGTKRPGHMGHERVTVKGLSVVRVDAERNLLLVRGAVPGPNGNLVMVRGE
ncbi:MAG TPA: 50S ribosomal protein L3 [Armatimonadota bacterium]|nr:50S ribosomal protein L3 [Armatimonadota bacterium]HOM82997.1 50S ribosomal protein L3 [Armatimonadota bacterium]HOQ27834.1 50S ribosomal protein L3 [Armatimonadota bacterium]HPO72089.1 50S ribosomal protein L3 [Armatimonadota bacterium]HPT98188.1 50S ribosomal protein L3 [Armatimonadota bacterium]